MIWRTMKMTANEQTVWLAALLEGEASWVKQKRTTKNGIEYYSFCVQCNMCDEDVLRRAYEFAGVGRFNGPYKQQQPHHQDFWRFTVHKRDHVQQLCLRILPYMGSRRSKKILEFIDMIETGHRRKPWRHGTRQGYEYRKCRCDDCRAANAKRFRDRRARMKHLVAAAAHQSA